MMSKKLKKKVTMTHTWHFIKNMLHETMEVLHIHIKPKNSHLKVFQFHYKGVFTYVTTKNTNRMLKLPLNKCNLY